MLDPLSALGIAAAAAQFLEFGTQLFSYTNELWKTGSTVGSEDLRKLTNDLVSLEGSIHKQLRTATTQKALSDEEQALYSLATECANIAHELETLIQKILRGDPKSRWRTFRTAFSTVWHRDDVERLAQRMDLYREQLALRILALLNANVTLQGESLEHLERDTKEIIEVLSINHNSINAIAESHHTAAKEWHRDDADLAEMRHEEVLAAIVTLKDGSSQTLRSNRSRSEPVAADRTQIPVASTYRRGSMHQKPGREPEPPGFIVSEFSQVPRRILDCLFFRELGDRQEVVAQSHGQTFNWLFDEDKQADSKWTNFTQWLISGRGCYWINGKAGSGKSTLMKFIASHYRTVEALRIWAGEEGLIKASFYFWNAGSTMQKSCSGLLRSLLFQIVEQDENLIPILFPSLCRTALAHRHEPLSEPTMAELKKAFSILTTDSIRHQKLCLFVDGIDECDGDYLEVLDLLERAGSSDRVKIVLSSRPIAACVDTLSSCAQLRLQDLTYEDVRLYVREKLSDHRLMKQLAKTEPAAAAKLIDSITSKASGVFLWVILVVRSILEGLQNFDTIGDLEQRLDELPDNLAKLYLHMFDTISVRYRGQGAFLFQLLLRSTEVQVDQPLSVQQLAFAVHKAPHGSISAPLRALTIEEGRTQCINMEGWMRSRCCGLVEAQDLPRSLEEATGSPKRMVGFLHRTVLEFLRTESVLGDIRHCTADDFVEPDLALLGSCLYEMKAESPSLEHQSKEYGRAWSCMRNALAYCKVLQEKFGKSFRDYILEIDSVSISYWGEQWRTIELRTLRCTSLDLALPNTLLLLSAFKGLTLFLKEETAKITAGEEDMTKELLLIHCFKDFFGLDHQSSVFHKASERLDLVADSIVTLLKQGANANANVFLSHASMKFGSNDHGRNTKDISKKNLWERIEGLPRLENESWFFPPEMAAGGEQTVWYLVLDQLFYYSGFAGALQLKSISRHAVDLILSLLEQLILGGADVDATFIAQYRLDPCSRIPHVRLSAFAVLELFLSRLKSGACDKIRQLMFERKASICAWRCLAEDHPPTRKTKRKNRNSPSLSQPASDPSEIASHQLYIRDYASTENMILCYRDADVESRFRAPSGSGKDASSGSLLVGKSNVAHTIQSLRESSAEVSDNFSSVRKGVLSSRNGAQPAPSRSRRHKRNPQKEVSSQTKAHPTSLPSRRRRNGIIGFILSFT